MAPQVALTPRPRYHLLVRINLLLAAFAVVGGLAFHPIASPGAGLDSAPTLVQPTTPDKPTDADGFIQRWIILEPISANGLTDSAVKAAVKKEYFSDQLSVVPK